MKILFCKTYFPFPEKAIEDFSPKGGRSYLWEAQM